MMANTSHHGTVGPGTTDGDLHPARLSTATTDAGFLSTVV